jgi:hypothetical protein
MPLKHLGFRQINGERKKAAVCFFLVGWGKQAYFIGAKRKR